MDKTDFKFANRFDLALFMACKSCVHCKHLPALAYVVGNIPDANGKFTNLSFDTKVKLVIEYREDCPCFEDSEPIERDTTYPGATYAPTDNNHSDILPDSTDIDYNPHQAKRCINQMSDFTYTPKVNNWDLCLKQLFDRKREPEFPSDSEVLRILNTSQIPQFCFKLGLPPQRGMGFDRGLWFYRSEKFNSFIEKNAKTKAEMKKLIMVYLYHVWFKKIPTEKKEGIFTALDTADKYSLAKDLSWWMLNVFKDETALATPCLNELGDVIVRDDGLAEIEFIPMSLLDKAQQAAMLAETDCNSMTELDLEAKEYDELIERLGYSYSYESIIDKEGHEIELY